MREESIVFCFRGTMDQFPVDKIKIRELDPIATAALEALYGFMKFFRPHFFPQGSVPTLRQGLALMVFGLCALSQAPAASENATGDGKALPLVRSGTAIGMVVVPKDSPASVRELADDFIAIVKKSTGVQLPLVTDDDPKVAASSDRPRLFLGSCRQTTESGLNPADLPEEGFRIAVRGSAIHVLGEPAQEILRPGSKIDPWYDSDPMRWALNEVLETQLGVRWLWPGDLGTYVPKHKDFSFPAIEKTYQPKLKMRTLRVATMRYPEQRVIRAEALKWVSNHQGGERDNIPLKHGFTDWWEKYHVEHPDYFAQPPEGVEQRSAGYVKLNLPNPKVLDQIVKNYEEAGKPIYWNVTPNDGAGFGVSDAVRAWDLPPNQSPFDIWTANGDPDRGQLTARYVKWWNMIYERLSALNPDMKLVTMAYSGYRPPPPAERPLTAAAIIGIVPSYRAYDIWSGWAAQADELILRPNWGHFGANAPHLPLKEIADYMKFAAENKMIGFYMDSIIGFWSTQGLSYYLMARLMVDPQRSVESIVADYCTGFGAGAPEIKAYFGYWQKLTDEWALGHKMHKDPNGKYDALIRERKIRDNPYIGPRQAIPYIYTDEVLATAHGFLDRADTLIGDSDGEARERVDFLRKGLAELKLTRDCMALGAKVVRKPTPELVKEFTQRAEELENLRTALTPEHVVWGRVITHREDKIKLKIRPRNMTLPTSSGEDHF